MTADAKVSPRDRLASKKARTVKRNFAMDPEIAEQYYAARGERDIAKLRHEADPADLAMRQAYMAALSAFDEAEAALRDNSVTFVLKSLGRQGYDDLIQKHRPTDEHRQMAAEMGGDPRNLQFNPDTFPAAVIAACLVEPTLTEAEVNAEIIGSENWNAAEQNDLFMAALDVNTQYRQVELGKGS